MTYKFKKGQEVKVKNSINHSGHFFEIGEIVKVIELTELPIIFEFGNIRKFSMGYLCGNGRFENYVVEEDLEGI